MKYFKGEREPIARNPVLRGVDLAIDRLVRQDCFTQRTLDILDALRAEVLGVSQAALREHYASDAPDQWIVINGMGGYICSVCGDPVESEPCLIHQPNAYARITGPAPDHEDGSRLV